MLDNAIINVNGDSLQVLDISLMLVVLALLPTMVVMMTSFTRYVICLSFTRQAMGTQQSPPNLVLVGMALVLTLFTMAPVLDEISENALGPYTDGEITQEEFFELAQDPLKRFMLRNTEIKSLELFCNMSGIEGPASDEEMEQSIELPLRVIVPSFVLSELKAALWIGFLMYVPFLLIDVVVASTLMSMGMVMLPPAMISTPFKILLFVMLDGWQLVFSTLVQGIR